MCALLQAPQMWVYTAVQCVKCVKIPEPHAGHIYRRSDPHRQHWTVTATVVLVTGMLVASFLSCTQLILTEIPPLNRFSHQCVCRLVFTLLHLFSLQHAVISPVSSQSLSLVRVESRREEEPLGIKDLKGSYRWACANCCSFFLQRPTRTTPWVTPMWNNWSNTQVSP